MKKIFFALALFFTAFFALGQTAKSAYTQKLMVLPYGGSELYTNIYVFNTVDEGEKIADEIFGVKNFKRLAESKDFKHVMNLVPEQGIIGYNYGIFVRDNEFWILRNEDNVHLYGLGRYLKP